MSTLVMKFGGASVATPEHFKNVADIIVRRREDYNRIVVVISAMGNMTNELISLAKQVNPDPPTREHDMLISAGERISMSLLAMALSSRGIEALSFTGSQSGIITSDDHTNAKIVDVRPTRIFSTLDDGKTAIVAGFQGVSGKKDVTTLGRGGSDTTAVAIAVALGAEKVEFYKDVRGICEEDPKINPNVSVLSELSYENALAITERGSGVLHNRAIVLAEKNNLLLHVRSFNDFDASGTVICGSKERSEKIYETAPSFV